MHALSELSVSETDMELAIEESSRSKKTAATKKQYLDGTSRKPYRVSSELSRSFGDGDNPTTSCEPSEWNERVCNTVAVLQCFKSTLLHVQA